jgi:hypothetical protein
MMVRGRDFRALFVLLAEELHFRRAAERLHTTQPSLSARVKALKEAEFDVCALGGRHDRGRNTDVGRADITKTVFAAPGDRAPESL